MKLVCTMPVRNSAWVLGLSARAVLKWVDALVILDHASVDGTFEIISEIQKEFQNRVVYLHESNPVWEEMRHRQRLLDQARDMGATHIVTVDDDEVLTGNLIPDIQRIVEEIPASQTLQLPWQCLRGSINRVHVSGTWGEAKVSTAFVDNPSLYWATRAGYDFHHRHPMGRGFVSHFPVPRECGGLMHLQFVSDRRLRAKQCLYKLLEVLRWPGRSTPAQINTMYDKAVYGGTNLATVPESWWAPYKNLLPHLRLDEIPWQEVEVLHLLQTNDPAQFVGLDLFGLDGNPVKHPEFSATGR